MGSVAKMPYSLRTEDGKCSQDSKLAQLMKPKTWLDQDLNMRNVGKMPCSSRHEGVKSSQDAM